MHGLYLTCKGAGRWSMRSDHSWHRRSDHPLVGPYRSPRPKSRIVSARASTALLVALGPAFARIDTPLARYRGRHHFCFRQGFSAHESLAPVARRVAHQGPKAAGWRPVVVQRVLRVGFVVGFLVAMMRALMRIVVRAGARRTPCSGLHFRLNQNYRCQYRLNQKRRGVVQRPDVIR